MIEQRSSLPFFSFSRMQGRTQERGPGIGVFESANGAQEEALYVVTEAAQPGAETLRARTVAAVEGAFRRARGSVTRRLTTALQQAHQRLQRENRRALPDEQQVMGITCLLFRGQEAFLAQAGPGFAVLYRPGLGFLDGLVEHDGLERALGGAGSLRVSLQRHLLAEGDLLLLANSRLPRLTSYAGLGSILASAPQEAVAKLYASSHGHGSFDLLLLGPFLQQSAPKSRPSHLGQRWRQAWQRVQPEPTTLRRFLLALALLLALANVALGVLLYPRLAGRQRQVSHAQALQQAQELWDRAQSAAKLTTVRESLNAALRQALRAQEGPRQREEAAELLARIREELERANRIRPLPDLAVAADLYRAGMERAQGDRLWILGDQVYLLDQGSGTVYRWSLDAEAPPEPLALPEPWSGAADLLWMPPGPLRSTPALLAIDRERRLLQLSGPTPRLLALRDAKEWSSFFGAAGYGGNLYVLDGQSNQVWRYLPTDAGYDSERKSTLEAPKLADGVDLAVDGDIYILTSAGRIRRFVAGREVPFPQTDLDTPLRRPSSLFLTTETRYLYVADTGNDRIVAFSREGAFAFQLRAPTLRAPHALFVEEKRGQLFVTVSHQLLRATLPGPAEEVGAP